MPTPASSVAYATYFDSGYLSRGLTLIRSMRAHGEPAVVHVLALDQAAYDYLSTERIENVVVHSLEQLEAYEPRLLSVKAERTRAEYIFTCTPWLLKYVADGFSSPGDLVVYLDADLAFFDSPQLVVQAMAGASVGIIEHRYDRRLARKLAKYGRFNVGWVGFRHDTDGHAVLDWYGERTLEWCYDSPLEGKYADQGYLDRFPEFAGVRVLESHGFNMAPWNQHGAVLVAIPAGEPGSSPIRINGDQLVFFHFHGLKKLRRRYVTGELAYSTRLSSLVKLHVYTPYVNALNEAEREVLTVLDSLKPSASRGGTGWSGLISKTRKNTLNVISTLIGNSLRTD